MMQLWCNGQWLDPLDFPVSPMDRGAILGLGLFETMLGLDGQPVFADRHLGRLAKSCERLGWPAPPAGLGPIMTELLVKNELTTGRARIRLAMTAGSGPTNDISLGTDPLMWMVAMPVGEPQMNLIANISPWPRNERSPLAGLKCASYAENLIALDYARRQGFEETIFLNTSGHLCEAATANLFLIKDGVLLTPSLDSGCLPGIAREIVLDLAGRCRLTREERPLTLEDLKTADEVFLTSSIRGLANVSHVGEQPYSKGMIVARLREYWNVEIESGI
ncbi:MAG: aminotransferase class IV [Luteolibacter sp.]